MMSASPSEHRGHASSTMVGQAPTAFERLASGKPIIVADCMEQRGGLLCAAATITAETATLMAVEGRGLLSVLVDPKAASRLGLVHMAAAEVAHDKRPHFLASIEAANCTGTGISAHDRAMTIRAVGDPHATKNAVRTPGHVMPILVGSSGGCRIHRLALDYLKSSTGYDVVGWCDLLGDDGELADVGACRRLAERIAVPLVKFT